MFVERTNQPELARVLAKMASTMGVSLEPPDDTRVRSSDVRHMWAQLARVRPSIGRDVAKLATAHLERHLPGLLATSAPTLGEGLDRLLEHEQVFHGKQAIVRERGEHADWFHYRPAPGERGTPATLGHAVVIEFLFASLAMTIRRTTTLEPPVAKVVMRHQALGNLRGYVDLFGMTPCFKAKRDSIQVSHRILETPQHTRNRAIAEIAKRHLEQLETSTISRDEHDRIGEAIAQLLAKGSPPSLADVADATRMSARTIQRRLQKRGTTYRELVESIRITLADRYLMDSRLTIGQIALLLGYSDHSAFARAYRRATGKQPRATRDLREPKR